MDHVILANESETVEIQTKTMDWARELMELFGWANTKSMHRGILGLRTKYNSEFDASKLFKELDQVKPADTHWTFMSPAAMIWITLAIFCIGLLIWKKCNNPPEPPVPTPSAPPMPMISANPGPTNKATKSNASISISISISWGKHPVERERYQNDIWSKTLAI